MEGYYTAGDRETGEREERKVCGEEGNGWRLRFKECREKDGVKEKNMEWRKNTSKAERRGE